MGKPSQSKSKKGSLSDGDIFAIPLTGLGYCHAVVARAPAAGADPDFAFLYVRPTPGKSLTPPKEIHNAAGWGKAWLGLIDAKAMRTGRWKACGRVMGFDPEQWPIPPRRVSIIDESEPVEKWGIDEDTGKPDPWGEMWSIEVTADEPTMTLIANIPAARAEALKFPAVATVNAASRLEKSLIRLARDMGWTFHDMPIAAEPIDAKAIKRWGDYAKKVRAKYAGFKPTWLPAGAKTDRGLAGGEWLAFPVTGGGFGVAMLVLKPPKHLRFFADAFVMSMRRIWDHWPTLADVESLTAKDGAQLTQTTMICVRDGRWRVLGRAPDFDPAEWPWPRPWGEPPFSKSKTQITFKDDRGKEVTMQMDPKVRKLDPEAGEVMTGMSSYNAIEHDVRRIIDRTHWSFFRDGPIESGIVTPERIKAWKVINAELEAALATGKAKPYKRPY